MKRLLKINAIVILLFSSLLTYFTFKNNDTSYWNTWGDINTSEKIYLKNTGYSGEDLYNLLTTLAKEKSINIIKTDYLEIGQHTKIVKSIFIANSMDDVFNQDTLHPNVNFIEQQDNVDTYISTKKSNDKNQKAQVFDPFQDDYVEFWSLKRFQYKQGNLDGIYCIRANQIEAVQSFVKEFSKRSGISIDELTTQTTYTGVIKSPIESISLIATIISLILFGILSIFYAVHNIKKIGIMKLNGYSNFHIWKSLIVEILTTMLFSAILIDIITLCITKNLTKDFLLYLMFIQVILIGVLILISSIVYFIIKKNTISNLIKNKRPIKLITSVTYILKSILLFITISFIVFMSAGFKDIEAEYKKLAQWNKVGDLAVLVNVNIGNDQASFSQGKSDLQKDFANYYHKLNQDGAMYIEVEEFIPHVMFKTKFKEATNSYDYVDYFNPNWLPLEYTTTNFLINPNYLKAYPLKDTNGKNIVVKENDARTILIPDTMADKEEALRLTYTAKYKDVLYADARRMHTDSSHIDDVQVKTLIYKTDKNGYFTFQTEYEKSNYKAYAPIFEVANENTMTISEKGNIQVQGLASPLKIRLGNVTSGDYNQKVSEQTAKYHLDDNNLRYMTIKEVFGNEIQSLKQACQQYFITIMICIMIMVLITVQVTQMILEIKKKKYCIQKLNGYSFIDRYMKILIANSFIEIAIASLSFICAPAFMNVKFQSVTIIMVIPLLILNYVLICCLLKYFENKNLTHIVKGE